MDLRNTAFGELNRFIYEKGYDQLCKAVSSALDRPVSAVIHQNQIGIEIDEDSVYYVFRAWVEYTPEKSDDLRLTCKITFDGISFDLTIIDAFDMKTESIVKPTHYGVHVKQNLIPDLHNEERREAEAERFLKRYCPDALISPMAVPIREIMEKQMGLNVVADIRLLDGADGQIIYSDSDELVMNDEGNDILVMPVRRGDVLIDGNKTMMRGMGSMNYTLAHEAYHWFAHRAYVDFHKLIGKQGDSSYNGISRYSSADILEIQAKAMPARILMPRDAFILKYVDSPEEDIHDRISGVASFFHVSYTAATLRLSQLGLYDIQQPTETVNVTLSDAGDLYFTDTAFRDLVDSEKIVYINNHYVINDPKYVELVWEDVPKYGTAAGPYRLTEYALSHPDEAFITFTIDYRRVVQRDDDILQARSDEHLRAQVERIRQLFPDEAAEMKRHATRFEKKFEKKNTKTFCELAKEMIDYRYGRMEDFDPVYREWCPESEMPETGEKYFSDDDSDTEYRYQDNLAPRMYDSASKLISEEASSPVELFCADTLQPRQYYEKIMKGKAGQPDNSTIMSLCVGLSLSPKAAKALFKSAGRALSWERTDMAYRYILHHLRGRYIEDVNVFLDDLAIDPIGAKKNIK